jgi:hypothetical protein
VSFLGVLMLDTRFPRLPGDVGHAASFAMPVRHVVVRGASPRRAVHGLATEDAVLLAPFIAAARELVGAGAGAITTSCGFLVRLQQPLQAALPVPVWTSALLALPTLPRPGVITVDGAALGPAHLRAAGAAPDTPIEGLAPGCAFQRTLLDDRPELDAAAAEAEVVAAALRLLRRHPQLQSLLLECTNMPPFAAALQHATGLPVHHLLTWVHEQWARL